MEQWLCRTGLLLGEEGLRRLAGAKVALLGLGGVGGSCAEALCRAGVGNLMLVDNDEVSVSNLNRQLIATLDTIGRPKTEAVAGRLRSINPQIRLTLCRQFYLPENSSFLYGWQPDLVLDAIDTVTAKLHLAQECRRLGIPLVSCLGTGNRLSPQCLTAGDITETVSTGCPLARVMRRELRRRGIEHLRVVYSTEPAQKAVVPDDENTGRHPPGSISFVPPVAGYILAAEGVQLLLGRADENK